MKTKKNQVTDYIKTNRRASREVEIESYGKPINYNRVQTSKKVYNRQKMKADVKRHLPSDFFRAFLEQKNILIPKYTENNY